MRSFMIYTLTRYLSAKRVRQTECVGKHEGKRPYTRNRCRHDGRVVFTGILKKGYESGSV
jgi:hypothetical protein